VTPARCRKVKGRGDEPRTEAPVNGGRNYNGQTAKGLPPCGRYQIWLSAGTSEYLSVLPIWGVTICRVRTISRKDHDISLQAERGILRGHTPDLLELEEEMVRPVWRHTERGRTRNDHAFALRSGVTTVPKVAKFLVG
jgi:hypothetical protein